MGEEGCPAQLGVKTLIPCPLQQVGQPEQGRAMSWPPRPLESPLSCVLVGLPEGNSHTVLLKGLRVPWQMDDPLQSCT